MRPPNGRVSVACGPLTRPAATLSPQTGEGVALKFGQALSFVAQSTQLRAPLDFIICPPFPRATPCFSQQVAETALLISPLFASQGEQRIPAQSQLRAPELIARLWMAQCPDDCSTESERQAAVPWVRVITVPGTFV